MSRKIQVPFIGVNDETVLLVAWARDEREYVRAGEAICSVETSKALVDIEAEADGFLVRLAEPGSRVAVGTAIGALLASVDGTVEPDEPAAAPQAGSARRWTKKAELVARRNGIDLEALSASMPGVLIGESEVTAAIGRTSVPAATGPELVDSLYPNGRQERVVVLGGAGGGGVIVLESLAHSPRQRAVGVLDNGATPGSQSVLGVPVLGRTEDALEIWRSGVCDAMVIAFAGNLRERAELFHTLREAGVQFTNVIDHTVQMRLNVSIGTGNVILANSYLGPCASVGDNNFLSSHTCLEHHSRLGSHCTFGPRVTTSGRVVIGDRIRFGTGISLEPMITVGDDAIIASGCSLTGNVPAGHTVKAHVGHSIRPHL